MASLPIKTTIYLFLAGFSLLLFNSCGKDNGENTGPGDGEYFMRFKVNGEQKEYKENVIGQVVPINSKALFSGIMHGYLQFPTAADQNHLGIIIFSESAVITKSYRNSNKAENSDGDKVPEVIMTYLASDKTGYISMEVPAVPFPPLDNIKSDVVVTLTEITTAYIKGSFSGTVYKSTDPNFATTLTISEGQFFLKRL